MKTAKIRVFFLSYYPPAPKMGGAMAFYRHFVERDDFELFAATDDPDFRINPPSYPSLAFDQPKWLDRIGHTRLFRWAHSYKHLVAGRFIPRSVMEAAEKFKPDLVFTIAGSWNWTAMMAQNLSKKLGVPLVGSFNDWFDFNIIQHPCLHSVLEKKFRAFYRSCDLALCTCEGMQQALGPHPNAHILYPIGARTEQAEMMETRDPDDKSRFVVAFAGNLSNWYGQMLQRLIETAIKKQAPVDFRIYGGNQSWSTDFDRALRERNIFRGQLPFAQLQGELARADALLLPMGFGTECEQIERTSFKTKFLDYLAIQKPIIVWGPEYCSAVRFAGEFDSAEITTEPDAEPVLQKILSLCNSPVRQTELIGNARRMYEDRFHPDKIHSAFVHKIRETIELNHAL